MSTDEKKNSQEDTRVFDTSGVMDNLIKLQREHPRETITLMDVAISSLSEPDRSQFMNDMEKYAYKYLSEKGKLKDCTNYVHKQIKEYILFASDENPDNGMSKQFQRSFPTIEEAYEHAEKLSKIDRGIWSLSFFWIYYDNEKICEGIATRKGIEWSI